MIDVEGRPSWRWVILAVGTLSQAATSSFTYGIPLLVPSLRHELHLSLVQAGVVVSAPIAGILLTLIVWGAAADRYGERVVIASGIGTAAILLGFASRAHNVGVLCVLLGLAGAAGASVNAASGRVVMGWFTIRERGLAMGARQTAQPLGVSLAALILPPVAAHHGVGPALLGPAAFCGLMTVAVLTLVVDPPRKALAAGIGSGSPYRESLLWRIHAASALLVVPQFAVASFTLVYLVGERNWDPTTAGRVIFAFQLAGAFGRIGSGVWSDRVGSRLRPMRQLAMMSALLMPALAIGAWTHSVAIVVVFGLAAIVTVADNGLAYIAVAEAGGAAWAGRALGIHNTGQNVASVLTAPLLAAVIGGGGRYGLAFILVAVVALLAIPLTPVATERARSAVRASAASSDSAGPSD